MIYSCWLIWTLPSKGWQVDQVDPKQAIVCALWPSYNMSPIVVPHGTASKMFEFGNIALCRFQFYDLCCSSFQQHQFANTLFNPYQGNRDRFLALLSHKCLQGHMRGMRLLIYSRQKCIHRITRRRQTACGEDITSSERKKGIFNTRKASSFRTLSILHIYYMMINSQTVCRTGANVWRAFSRAIPLILAILAGSLTMFSLPPNRSRNLIRSLY